MVIFKDKLQLTGHNPHWDFKYRISCEYGMHSCSYWVKVLDLKLKIQPKQLLDSVSLDIEFSVKIHLNKRIRCTCVIMASKYDFKFSSNSALVYLSATLACACVSCWEKTPQTTLVEIAFWEHKVIFRIGSKLNDAD